MTDELLEAWRTNHRINMLLLEAISDEGLGDTLSTRGGRDVARQLAHMHDIRRYHLENRRAQDLAEPLRKFASKDAPSRDELIAAHEASTEAVATFLAQLSRGEENRRGFKKGIFTTLAYFVAHEAHHRGSIILTLKQSGHPVDKDVRYAIWDWDRR